MSNQVFWLIWNERGHAPTCKHQTRPSAVAEAERLARMNPGQSFHVLQLAGTCRKVDVEWSNVSDPFEPPF